MKQPHSEAGLLWRVLQFPLTRIVVSLSFVLSAAIVVATVVRLVVTQLQSVSWVADNEGAIYAIPIGVAIVAAYRMYVLIVEKREATEVRGPGALREFAEGAAVATGLMVGIVGILWVLGYYQVSGTNSWVVLLTPIASILASSLGEELAFRAIVFRISEEWLGSVPALLISSVLFGLLHAGNPSANWVSTVAIMLEAGVLLGAVYMLTKRIWMVWGLHFAWNYVQGTVFGIEVSGTERVGLFLSDLIGPEILSGGTFGAEASAIAVVLCLSAGMYLLNRIQRRGGFKPPFWNKTVEGTAK